MGIQSTKHNKARPFLIIWAWPARKPTKNYTKLCKTKPILKTCQCPQALLYKQLTKISVTFGNQKTKPIQSQTKPISKMTKINANCLSQRDYEQKMAFFRKKNKANYQKSQVISQGRWRRLPL